MNSRPVPHVVLAVCLGVTSLPLLAAEPEPSSKLFDRTRKVFVINGYSTSRHWPKILQRKLDRYFDGKRVIEVRPAIKGGTPIAKWINAETGKRSPAWNRALKPKLQREDDRPTVVLAQQSLQWAYGERSKGIRGPDDRKRIKQGADVLRRYAQALLEDGADQVFIAMHIYKKPMEPEIGNERLALAELMKRRIPNVYAGPDVWEPTKAHYPQAFARDRKHPNQIGAEIMAQKWFETLLRHDGRDVPEWSRKERAEAIQSEPKKAGRQATRRKANQSDDSIDWKKARKLRRKKLGGGKLTKEEEAYLARAKKLRRERLKARRRRRKLEPKPSTGLIPLMDMSAEQKYKGQDGGLYGGGRNHPPKSHLQAALREARKIQPLDSEGNPSEDGKIVLISNGMSNTTQEFQAFLRLADDDPQKSPSVVIVDGAQGGMEASDWAHPEKRFRRNRPNPWDVLDRRLRQAGVTSQQVQVVWIKQARRNPASLGEFPKHADELKDNLVAVLQKLKERFPNLRLADLSSRIYAGYATTPLNPEPFAYESAFSVRWLVQDQINGKPGLNFDAEKGDVKAPLVLWGPYLWADGTKGRKTDNLVWQREDLAGDGTHPSRSGRRKVAQLLLEFFKTDPTTKPWFVKPDGN